MATILNLSDLVNKANGKEEAKKELRKQYKMEAAKLHPDKGGNEAEMAKLNEEYQTKEALLNLDDELMQAVEKIMNLDGINIEICGTWIWVSGDTRANKDTLKEAGFRWAKKKMMWYYRKAEDAHYHRGKGATMAHIREKYGSEELKQGGTRALLSA